MVVQTYFKNRVTTGLILYNNYKYQGQIHTLVRKYTVALLYSKTRRASPRPNIPINSDWNKYKGKEGYSLH